jgi:NADH-quinone oxidoreductase subunit H
MNTFTAEDSLRSRWSPNAKPRAVRWFAGLGVLSAALLVVLWFLATQLAGAGYVVALLGIVVALLLAVTCFGAALVIQFSALVGRLLFKFAFPIFCISVLGIVVIAWAPALLYGVVDPMNGDGQALTVSAIEAHLAQHESGASRLWTAGAYGLWPLQFRVTRDVLAAIGVLSFVSIFASFAIWWERKVAGRIQSRLGPMRVGGWHGWAQSMADGIKCIQKEDLLPGGSDQPLFRIAIYATFVPALCLFLALPFSAAWIGRDLNIGLIFIFAMLGLGVLGVLVGGWASNNKWSMYGAMREACQMVSYEIPLGFSLLVPIMIAGTLRLTTIGELQSGGFQTWLAFRSPFTFIAAITFFIATLASCKRAPFDLPEAESELVAGYHTEFSGFRWAVFFFAEYAEMFAAGALAAILFLGAWYSPLPASWGAAWATGPLWQRALHGVLFSGPLWVVGKGFFLVYVQIWLRWTLPRIRIDQVMHACIKIILPVTMVVLLGNTFWELFVRPGSGLAIAANAVCTALGAAAVLAFIGIMIYGLRYRRRLVGTLAIDHLPGA